MPDTEKTLTLKDRDQTLTFVIRKMPPLQLENWLVRALRTMVREPEASGGDYLAAGRKLAAEGFWALVSQAADSDALFLLADQLLTCCSRRVGAAEMRCSPETVDSCIQEVTTLFTLKNEALKFNLEFLLRRDGALEGAPDVTGAGTQQ